MISSDYGELVPKTVFSKKISISSSERGVVAFGLFPRPFFVLFCFVFFFSVLFALPSMSLSIS